MHVIALEDLAVEPDKEMEDGDIGDPDSVQADANVCS